MGMRRGLNTRAVRAGLNPDSRLAEREELMTKAGATRAAGVTRAAGCMPRSHRNWRPGVQRGSSRAGTPSLAAALPSLRQ